MAFDPEPRTRDDLLEDQVRELSRQLDSEKTAPPEPPAMDPKPDNNHWHLDKKVPISIIVALFLQFLAGVWFVGKLESRVAAAETAIIEQRLRDAQQDTAAAAAVALLRSDLTYIRGQLDQVIRDLRKP